MIRDVYVRGLAMGLGVLVSVSLDGNAAELGEEPAVQHGWLIIPEEEWMAVTVTPAGYFSRAHACFVGGNRDDAAREIRAKATLVKVESRRAGEQSRQSLVQCVGKLRRLARDVEDGKVEAPATLAQAFAETEFRLAEHHFLKAREYEVSGETVKMGHDISACAAHLLDASMWSDTPLDRLDVEAAHEARSTARGLMHRSAPAAQPTRGVLRGVGKAIRRFARRGKLRPLPAIESFAGDEGM